MQQQSPLNVDHYRQRASAGLSVTEGIYPSAMGCGYLFTPGLHTDAQEAGWSRVTDGVHAEGGAIFGQIMHVGRLSDPLLLEGAQPIAPVAVKLSPVFPGRPWSPPARRTRQSIRRPATTATRIVT